MTEIELLKHVTANREAGKKAGAGLLYEGRKSVAKSISEIAWRKASISR